MKQVRIALSLLCLLSADIVYAQATNPKPSTATVDAAFDVVSIKPNTTGKVAGPCCGFIVDVYRAGNVSLEETIKAAYIQPPLMRNHVELLGAPSWVKNDRYDIVAKVDADTATRFKAIPVREWYTAVQPLLQKMLAERFGLIVHRVPVEVAGYALVVGKRGAKLTPSPPGEVAPPEYRGAGESKAHLIKNPGFPLKWSFINTPIASVAELMSAMSNEIIVDQTGIQGAYDLDLIFLDEHPNVSLSGAFTWDLGRLGLQLKPIRVKTETLVIDHIDRPSPD